MNNVPTKKDFYQFEVSNDEIALGRLVDELNDWSVVMVYSLYAMDGGKYKLILSEDRVLISELVMNKSDMIDFLSRELVCIVGRV